MIKKSLVTALILLIAHAFVSRALRDQVPAGQDQWQRNLIKAQRFIYQRELSAQDVIVGSSLSCRLVQTNLPGIYVLAFSGLAIFDGLEIISRLDTPPRNIHVEMNFVLREPDDSFTSSLYSPILYYGRAALPSLREENQPVARVADKLINSIKRRSSVEAGTDNASLFDQVLALQIPAYSTAPEERLVARKFAELKQRVSLLEGRGARFTFFEMPVNPRLCQLPRARIIRESFQQHFPPSKYRYVAMPDCGEYQTSDGMHLRSEEALKYTTYLREALAK